MATSNQATWKRLFDSVDRTVGTRVNDFARSEDFATVAALGRRAQTKFGQFTERASRRILHSFNLPAGSDVNRLLGQIALLEREVRDLRKELEQPPPPLPGAAAGASSAAPSVPPSTGSSVPPSTGPSVPSAGTPATRPGSTSPLPGEASLPPEAD
jgi:hypothetical protein